MRTLRLFDDVNAPRIIRKRYRIYDEWNSLGVIHGGFNTCKVQLSE